MKYLLALVAMAGIWVSVLALRVHNQAPGEAPPCAVTEKFDCGAVNHSRFAVFPPRTFDEPPGTRHVPIAIIGIAGYALMALVALTGRLGLLLFLAEAGFLMAGFLTYLEAYVLQKWCIYCLWSQASSPRFCCSPPARSCCKGLHGVRSKGFASMWPKVFAQLVELLPHISRLVPMADMFFTTKTASEKANEAALAALAATVREDLGKVTSSHDGLYRTLQQQGGQIAELSANASRARLAAESCAEQGLALERKIVALGTWVKAAVLLLVLLLGAVVLLLLRVH